jgi:serine/threonine-protein kinase
VRAARGEDETRSIGSPPPPPSGSAADAPTQADPRRAPPPAAAAGEASGDPFPERIGPYRVVGLLGRGGMGIVYEALDTRLERPVALKVIAPGAGAEMRARFLREARSMARLGKHPHLVQVHEAERYDGRDVLVMELVRGTTLAEMLRAGPLAPRRAAEIGEKVARALDHAHRHGLIHRDVKPSNVLLGEGGEPQVGDFGLCLDAASEERLSASGAILGTPSYMAPEQAESPARVDARADVYGVGALLYHATTGRPPFEGGGWAATLALVLEANPTPPSALRAGLSRDLEAVIERAMERDPARRYESAGLLADDLGRLARGEPVVARPRPLARRLLGGARRKPLLAAGFLAAIVLGAGAAALAPGVLAARAREASEAARASAAAAPTAAERIAALGRAIELDPLSWRAFADRARARVEEAERVERDNDRFGARYDVRPLLEEARSDCDRALALREDAAEALLLRAELRERLLDAAGAEEDHARYEALDPKAASAYVARGRRRWERGDRAGAIAFLDRAVRLAPRSVEPLLVRGPWLAEIGRTDEAIADYDRAIELEPGSARLHYGRAHLVQRWKGDMKGALAGFDEAVRLAPEDGNNWFARGNLRRLVRPPDIDGAIEDYRKAIALAPSLNGPATNLGILLSSRGRQAEAREAFDEAIRRDPSFGMNYFGRAMTFLAETPPDPKAARADLDRACERESRQALPFWRRAALREEAGDLAGALLDFKVAAARVPEKSRERAQLEEAIAEVSARLEGGGARPGDVVPLVPLAPEGSTPSARPRQAEF